ncbi:MAG: superoxide dismutase family protein [Acidobacteriota bacterium]
MFLVLAACGGGKKSNTTTPSTGAAMDKKDEPAEPAEAEKPAEPAKPAEPEKPPAPKMFHAKASLTPVKGAKVKAATITFEEEEGKPATVTSSASLEGLKAGKYHLTVHDAKDCGPNATKAGKPFAPAASADVAVEAKKDGAKVDASDVDVKLNGDDSIVGHVLVLSADKKGKPGKALACGPITASDDEDDAAKKE